MFNNKNKTILVTGCAGFIGSNFVPYFLNKYKNYNLVNLDLLTYAGNLENLKECETNPNYKFIKGDNGKTGETYNIGGRNERTNLQIVNTITTILDQRVPKQDKSSYKEQITFVEDRAGHDRRYQ